MPVCLGTAVMHGFVRYNQRILLPGSEVVCRHVRAASREPTTNQAEERQRRERESENLTTAHAQRYS